MRQWSRFLSVVLLAAFLLSPAGCGGGSGGTGNETPATEPTAGPGPQVEAGLPEVPATAGQVVFSISGAILPETVAGYIVGKQDLLKIESAPNGLYYINNVPAGKHDVILTASSFQSSLSYFANQNPDRGIRIADIEVLNGVRTSKDNVVLSELAVVSGIVRLVGEADHSGVVVRVPGTEYTTNSDGSGAFSFAGIPVGVHNFYFERAGFYRGQIEEVSLEAGIATELVPLKLVADTGAEGLILIGDGNPEVESRTVLVAVGATGDANMMKVSEDPNFADVRWKPLQSTFTFTFETEGLKTLYAKFATAEGTETARIASSVRVRLFPTSVAVNVADGATSSNTRTVSVELEIPPNASEMRLSEFSDFEGANWTSISEESPFVFTQIGIGKVFVQFKDPDGFESSVYVSNTIDIEIFGSNEGNITINNGAETAASRTVSLAISKPANASSMKLSESSDFVGASWIPAATNSSFTFAGEGNRAVYVKFKDNDSFESATWSDGIVVDIFGENEGAVTINGGAATATSRTVSLAITKPANASSMKLSESSDFVGASWIPAATSSSFTFAGEGSRTVYVKFKNGDGFESSTWSDQIAVDLFGENEGAVVIDGGSTSTLSKTVTLSITVPTNAAEMRASEASDFGGTNWTTPAATSEFSFGQRGLSKAVFVQFRDDDGFLSHVWSSTIDVLTPTPTWENQTPASCTATSQAAIPELKSIFMLSGGSAWIVGSFGGYLRSSNGLAWTDHGPIVNGHAESIYFSDESNGWAVYNGGIARTIDGGGSWTLDTTTFGSNLYEVKFYDSQKGMIAAHGQVLMTANGGTTWSVATIPIHTAFYGITNVGENKWWAVGYNGSIIHSSDGGQSWEDQSLALSAGDVWFSVSFLNENRGWIVSRSGQVAQTLNGGATWSFLSDVRTCLGGSGAPELRKVRFVSETTGWASGDGVFRTLDGGVSWERFLPNVANDTRFFGLYVQSENKIWVSGTNCRVFYSGNAAVH